MNVSRSPLLTHAKKNKTIDFATWFVVLLALILGAIVRLAPVLAADFPLNDGGMVYALTDNLRQNHYVLPGYTTYNSANIPFAYPPLAFYLLAFLQDISGSSLLTIMRVLPAVVSSLSILAFYSIAGAVLPSKSQAAIAILAFTFVPRSFEWLIMGGGITRSLGFFFSLLTIAQVHRLYTQGGNKNLLITILLASLTVLSHPESSWFVVYTAALMFLFYGRNRAGVARSFAVAAGVLAVTAVWWISIIHTHGLRPLTSATGSHVGTSWLGFLMFDLTDEPLLRLVGVLGLLGLFWCIAEKRVFLPIWLVLIFVLESRSANTMAMVPLSILAAIGLEEIVLRPFLYVQNASNALANATVSWAVNFFQSRATKGILAFFLFYSLSSAFIFVIVSPLYKVLPVEERNAMQWTKENTPVSSQFLVFSGSPWWQDASSEWFPVFAERASLFTVQGAEWLPANEFKQRWDRFDTLQFCANADIICLHDWLSKNPVSFQYIYLSDRYLNTLADSTHASEYPGLEHYPKLYYSLKGSTEYSLVFEQSGVAIFQKVKPFDQ